VSAANLGSIFPPWRARRGQTDGVENFNCIIAVYDPRPIVASPSACPSSPGLTRCTEYYTAALATASATKSGHLSAGLNRFGRRGRRRPRRIRFAARTKIVSFWPRRDEKAINNMPIKRNTWPARRQPGGSMGGIFPTVISSFSRNLSLFSDPRSPVGIPFGGSLSFEPAARGCRARSTVKRPPPPRGSGRGRRWRRVSPEVILCFRRAGSQKC